MYSDEALVREALRHGARGFVLKGAVSEELLLAVRAAARGATYLSPAISGALLPSPATPPSATKPDGPRGQLTPREREVLGLVGKGLTNAEIATQLGISAKTVERHRTNLMAKLDAHSLVELMRIGIKHGLIRLDE
jgi:DNA-binding NarL/FixJ family response regulator